MASRPAHRRDTRVRLTRRGRLVLTSATVLTLVLVTGGVVATTRHGSTSDEATVTAAHTTPARRTTTSTSHPATPPTPTPTPTVARDAHGVPIAVEQAFAAAGGDLSVAVYDATDGQTWTYHDEAGRVEASVSKLSVLGSVLRAQQAGATQTDAISDEEEDMIEHSDNNAAAELYEREGRSAVATFDAAVGASIVSDDDGLFGLDTSTALDQVEIMKAYAYPNAVLTSASRALAASLFGQVEADQHWGASGGVPTGVTVDLKNGWLPHGTGWVVNTVGHVSGDGHDYVVAIMSAGNTTEQAGIDRLQAVSAAVWKTSGT